MSVDVASKLFPNMTTLIVQLLSTGVLLILFKKYLWASVQAYFEKRASFIESTINEAKDMNEKAKAFMVESEEQARESAREYRDIVERARVDALKVRDDIVADAKKEAASKLEQAEKEIHADKEQAKEQIKEEIVEIAIEMASKVLNKEMDSKENQEMIESFLDQVEK